MAISCIQSSLALIFNASKLGGSVFVNIGLVSVSQFRFSYENRFCSMGVLPSLVIGVSLSASLAHAISFSVQQKKPSVLRSVLCM